MGPINLALVKLFEADKELRAVQSELDDVTHNVRVLARKIADLDERHRLTHARHVELQAQYKSLELEMSTRDAHIEKLRAAQQAARNNREYQALLVQISTEKVDRTKLEEQALRLLEQIERVGAEAAALASQLASEKEKHAVAESQIGDRVAELRARIEQVRPSRDAAAADVPRELLSQFDRLSERYDGEALAAIMRPNPRREEYSCSACNMDMVPDVYNRLHNRDEVVYCPSCRRMLYIPDDLPPHAAVNQPSSSPKKSKTTRVRRKTKDEAANKGNVSTPPVLSKWDAFVTRAQGESVRAAVEADHAPVVCQVSINGDLVGQFKGKTVDHLCGCIKLILAENQLSASVEVTAATVQVEPTTTPESEPPTERPAGDSPSEPVATAPHTPQA